MKSLHFFLCLLGSVILISCDNNESKKIEDPVFDAEYTPLKNLDEITSKTWKYEGAKVGNGTFGKVKDNNCASRNTLFFDGEYIIINLFSKVGNIDFDGNILCESKHRRVFGRKSVLVYEGILDVAISGQEKITVTDPNSDKKEIRYIDDPSFSGYGGKIEIGFQSGMLRMEDKYSGTTSKEKVYAYFTKL